MVLDYIQSGELYHGENNLGQEDVLNRALKQLVAGLASGEADTKANNVIFKVDSAVDFEQTVVDGDLVIYDSGIAKFRKYQFGTDSANKIVIGFADVTNELVILGGFSNIFTGLVAGTKYYASTDGGITDVENTLYVGTATTASRLYVNIVFSDADTLDGQHGTYYLDWNNLTNVPPYLGGAKQDIFYENNQIVDLDYTMPIGKNAMTAGDITIADGITVTIPDGSRWVIV